VALGSIRVTVRSGENRFRYFAVVAPPEPPPTTTTWALRELVVAPGIAHPKPDAVATPPMPTALRKLRRE
jgi:hypothetical protein